MSDDTITVRSLAEFEGRFGIRVVVDDRVPPGNVVTTDDLRQAWLDFAARYPVLDCLTPSGRACYDSASEAAPGSSPP